MQSKKIMKKEFSKNDEIVLGFSCYTHKKASRRLSAFRHSRRWKVNELFRFLLKYLLKSSMFHLVKYELGCE
jgi:hypothetical protein